jgi:hypothetical protein
VKKSKDFNPLGRAESWSKWKHYRFNWLAGKHTIRLNYPTKYSSKSVQYFLYNVYASVYYVLHRIFFKVMHALAAARHGLKAMVREFKKDF